MIEEIKEVVTPEAKKEIPLEVYDIANLKFKCHCCGNEQLMDENVKGGIRFDLYTTNKHKLVMACSKCKAMLEMGFEKSEASGIIDLDGQAIPKSKQKVEVTSQVPKGEEFTENPSNPKQEFKIKKR